MNPGVPEEYLPDPEEEFREEFCDTTRDGTTADVVRALRRAAQEILDTALSLERHLEQDPPPNEERSEPLGDLLRHVPTVVPLGPLSQRESDLRLNEFTGRLILGFGTPGSRTPGAESRDLRPNWNQFRDEARIDFFPSTTTIRYYPAQGTPTYPDTVREGTHYHLYRFNRLPTHYQDRPRGVAQPLLRLQNRDVTFTEDASLSGLNSLSPSHHDVPYTETRRGTWYDDDPDYAFHRRSPREHAQERATQQRRQRRHREY